MNNHKRSSMILLVLAVLVLNISTINQQFNTGSKGFLSVQQAEGQTPSIKSFVVIVSSAGFNGSESSNLRITANQGDKVQITFMMDEKERNDTSPENHHIIEITGYGLRTEDINPSHPKSTITFLADQLGRFTIRCSGDTSDCPGHYSLQDGVLEVKNVEQTSTTTTTATTTVTNSSTSATTETTTASTTTTTATTTVTTTTTAAGSSGPLPTNLKLSISLTCFPQCPIKLKASLTDSEGNPIVGMPVVFKVNTTFGVMKLGSNYTDSNGIASMNYLKSTASSLEVVASFAGGGGYQRSTFSVVKQLPEITSESSPQLLILRNVIISLVVAVVLALWGHYAYALYQVRGISKESSRSKKRE